MLTWSMQGMLHELWQPLVIVCGGAVGEIYFERKDKPGLALLVKIAAIAAFVFLWLIPMFDRISWLFRGAMALPIG